MTSVADVHRFAQRVSGEPVPLRVLSLRRKPRRGLVVRYASVTSGCSWTATVDEETLAAECDAEHLPDRDHGILLAPFPTDGSLPFLQDALDPMKSDTVLDALSAAYRVAVGDDAAWVDDVRAAAIRYKVGERCVVRYEIDGVAANGPVRTVHAYAKLFADHDDASRQFQLGSWLWSASDSPVVARPLAVSAVAGIVITEAAAFRGAEQGESVLRRGTLGELRAAADSLRWLHARRVDDAISDLLPKRAASAAVEQLRSRAGLIAASTPSAADHVLNAADRVGRLLSELSPVPPVVSHGAYKPSQLVFVEHRRRAVVIDFDGARLTDAAYDVGYFLAYLRGTNPWSSRATAASTWLPTAQQSFLDTYGADVALTNRARAYEAATLFKIAARRINRLQSPRPNEITRMLSDVRACLDRTGS